MSDSFLDAFDKLASLGDNPSVVDVATVLASAPADTAQSGQDSTPPAGDTVSAAEGQDTLAAAEGQDTLAGTDTVQAAEGQDTVPAGQDSIAAATAPPAGKDTTTEDDEAFLQRMRRIMQTPPEETTTTAPSTDAPPLYTKEETDLLATYEKDWPDVAKAEALRRKSEYVQLLQHVFTEVAKFMQPHLDTLDAVATRTHTADLTTKVTDYEAVREQVIKWTEAQPKYLQPAYRYVIEKGTADEVADLVTRWRAETQQPAATTQATAPKPVTALPPAAKQAAAALAPVASKRSAVSAGVDPGDFNSAFEAAAAAEKV